MNHAINATTLPQPPEKLSFQAISLRLERMDPGNSALGFVPFYQFHIWAMNTFNVGTISFRIGRTDHVRLYVGHIGYEILEPFRGHRYAEHACRAVAPFVRSIYRNVIITSDPQNAASLRTIERLGALFLEEVNVPRLDSLYLAGSRRKRRYQWTP